jgi:uncharacterized membrane protein
MNDDHVFAWMLIGLLLVAAVVALGFSAWLGMENEPQHELKPAVEVAT